MRSYTHLPRKKAKEKRTLVKSPVLNSEARNNKSILFRMKAARIVAIAVGALAVLCFLVINFIPEGMIVGIHFSWPFVHPQRGFTGYPPSVYINVFLSCPSDGPCVREDTFRVDPIPHGCCTMLVTNGDGRGTDEVRSYDIFLNGERVVPAPSQNGHIKLQSSNTLKVILAGDPHSKISVLITYDPRESR